MFHVKPDRGASNASQVGSSGGSDSRCPVEVRADGVAGSRGANVRVRGRRNVSRETAPVDDTYDGPRAVLQGKAVPRTHRLSPRERRRADDASDGRAHMFHVKRFRAKPHLARRLLLVCSASRRRGRHGGGRVGHGCSFVQRRRLRARTQGRASSRWRVMNGARSPHGCMYMLGKEDRSPHVVGEGP
jgi:hypothetical protein